MSTTHKTPTALDLADGSAFYHGGVWCCTKQCQCGWQGFALHQGIAWGQIPVDEGPYSWRHHHDLHCDGKLIQLLPPNDGDVPRPRGHGQESENKL